MPCVPQTGYGRKHLHWRYFRKVYLRNSSTSKFTHDDNSFTTQIKTHCVPPFFQCFDKHTEYQVRFSSQVLASFQINLQNIVIQ